MVIIVKFKGIGYNSGEPIEFFHTLESEEFVNITKPNFFKASIPKNENLSEPQKNKLMDFLEDEIVIDVFEQANEWLDDRDNIDIINEYNLIGIVDYEVISVGDTSNGVDDVKELSLSISDNGGLEAIKIKDDRELEYLIEEHLTGRFKGDFLACYTKMYKNISTLSAANRFSIVLDSVVVAYDSSISTLEEHNSYTKRLNDIPKEVWNSCFNQGNMSRIEFIKKYMNNNLDKKYLS